VGLVTRRAVGVGVFVDDHRTKISRGGLVGAARRFVKEDTHDKLRIASCCLLLQYLMQSCARGGRRIGLFVIVGTK
jgi:hypothetical protein